MTNTPKTIALVGDSVLDDFYWLKDPTQDVKQQLSDLMSDIKIYNFAVDESTIIDVLEGCYPPPQYTEAREEIFGGKYPYPTTKKGTVYPLKLLVKYQPEYVVLSIGGNDGRIHLDSIIWGADALIKEIVNDGMEEKFNQLIAKIFDINSKVNTKLVLVLVYQPHETIFQRYRESIGWGMQFIPIENIVDFSGRIREVYKFFRSVFVEMARKYNIPIIDLALTLDPKNKTHYGSTPIEPSNKSGKAIAALIQYVTENHDFSGRPCAYYMPDCREEIVTRHL